MRSSSDCVRDRCGPTAHGETNILAFLLSVTLALSLTACRQDTTLDVEDRNAGRGEAVRSDESSPADENATLSSSAPRPSRAKSTAAPLTATETALPPETPSKPTRTPSPTPDLAVGESVVDPYGILVDGARGRVYARGHARGGARTLIFNLADGQLLEAIEPAGRLALDDEGGRLVILEDGASRLAIHDLASGWTSGPIVLSLPPEISSLPASPQPGSASRALDIDAREGWIYFLHAGALLRTPLDEPGPSERLDFAGSRLQAIALDPLQRRIAVLRVLSSGGPYTGQEDADLRVFDLESTEALFDRRLSVNVEFVDEQGVPLVWAGESLLTRRIGPHYAQSATVSYEPDVQRRRHVDSLESSEDWLGARALLLQDGACVGRDILGAGGVLVHRGCALLALDASLRPIGAAETTLARVDAYDPRSGMAVGVAEIGLRTESVHLRERVPDEWLACLRLQSARPEAAADEASSEGLAPAFPSGIWRKGPGEAAWGWQAVGDSASGLLVSATRPSQRFPEDGLLVLGRDPFRSRWWHMDHYLEAQGGLAGPSHWLSADGGQPYRPLDERFGWVGPLPSAALPARLAAIEGDGRMSGVYAVRPRGYFVSEDRGETWTKQGTLPEASGHCRLVDASRAGLAPSVLMVACMQTGYRIGGSTSTEHAIWQSPDEGRSWSQVFPDEGRARGWLRILRFPADPGALFLLLQSSADLPGTPWLRAFRSGDGAASWAEFGQIGGLEDPIYDALHDRRYDDPALPDWLPALEPLVPMP